jgi:hypothetical protein
VTLRSAEYYALTTQFGFRVLQHAIDDAQAGGRTVRLCQRNALPYGRRTPND